MLSCRREGAGRIFTLELARSKPRAHITSTLAMGSTANFNRVNKLSPITRSPTQGSIASLSRGHQQRPCTTQRRKERSSCGDPSIKRDRRQLHQGLEHRKGTGDHGPKNKAPSHSTPKRRSPHAGRCPRYRCPGSMLALPTKHIAKGGERLQAGEAGRDPEEESMGPTTRKLAHGSAHITNPRNVTAV